MRKSSFREPKKVLIFNIKRELIAIVKSLSAASEVTGISSQTISLVCTGRRTMSRGLYFRHIDSNIEIILDDDLGILNLIDYDRMCKEIRYYYPKDYDPQKRNYMRRMTEEQIKRFNK